MSRMISTAISYLVWETKAIHSLFPFTSRSLPYFVFYSFSSFFSLSSSSFSLDPGTVICCIFLVKSSKLDLKVSSILVFYFLASGDSFYYCSSDWTSLPVDLAINWFILAPLENAFYISLPKLVIIYSWATSASLSTSLIDRWMILNSEVYTWRQSRVKVLSFRIDVDTDYY